MSYKIVLEKENFKFSCSHFTIFGAGLAERLHGHNYYVSVEIRLNEGAIDSSVGMAFDFNDIKPLIKEITDSLDEYVLLPDRSEHLAIGREADNVQAVLAAPKEKHYSFPAEDVRVLPLSNISSEELARYIATELSARIKKPGLRSRIDALQIGVQETRGQSVYFELRLTDKAAKP